MWKELTEKDGGKVWINLDNIVAIKQYKDETCLFEVGGDLEVWWTVKETPQEILGEE